MTEAEWLACGDPAEFLDCVAGCNTARKLRLFAVACCRRAWHRMTKEATRHAVECAEQFADGDISRRELEVARQAALRFVKDSSSTPAQYMATSVALVDFRPKWVADLGRAPLARAAISEVAEEESQLALIRDIFGNPFRPVAFSPSWQTCTTVALAQQMYAARDFSAMPLLADALQAAGCDNEDILDHCRGQGPHVRGCWVVDMLLGKE
jgi:hypothetical protein